MTYGLNEVEAVSLCEASEVKMEARFEIFTKFHVRYSFALSRRDCVGHPRVDNHLKTATVKLFEM